MPCEETNKPKCLLMPFKIQDMLLYYICLAGRNQVYTANIINRVAGLQEKNAEYKSQLNYYRRMLFNSKNCIM
jgi:hypothetical protein